MTRPDHTRLTVPAAATAIVVGVAAAVAYDVQDLTLSHYDARAHLVVARRIIDSIRPGWPADWCRLAPVAAFAEPIAGSE